MSKATHQKLRQNPLSLMHFAMDAEMLLWKKMLVPACYSSDIQSEQRTMRTSAGLTHMSGIKKCGYCTCQNLQKRLSPKTTAMSEKQKMEFKS